MIKEIVPLYNEAIFKEAQSRFGIRSDKIQDLGGFESFVYAYEKEGKEYILKVAHTLHRSEDYLMGELEFVNHLANGGVNTALVVPSLSGKLVEEIPAEKGSFFAYAFEKVPGRKVKKEDCSPEMYFELGKLTGRMHRLTQSFKPSTPAYKRNTWSDDRLYQLENFFPAEEAVFLEKCNALLKRIKDVKPEYSNFGLIHGDLHQSNFFWDGHLAYPFDFDDCEYNFFVNDLAVSLYYFMWFIENPAEYWSFSKLFLEHYLKGYRTEFHIDNKQLELLPDFMRIRHLVMYTIRYDMFEVDQIPLDHQKKMQEIKNLLMRDGDVRDIPLH